MYSFSIVRRHFNKFILCKRGISTCAPASEVRNVGIIAHVDAGKTTTTERMLFYSGSVITAGNVDHGDTVTDFMPQERERGITIASAAISFDWKKHQINLIDTPGHVDFTYEVERSLRVLDGAVTIIDAVAGVQAQTLTVWRQAKRQFIPRVIFVNKIDREGANLQHVLSTMRDRLGFIPLVTQLPVGEGSNFRAIVDLVTMELIEWSDQLGSCVNRRSLSNIKGSESLLEKSLSARALTECDDDFADAFLMNDGNSNSISADDLNDALRRVTYRAGPCNKLGLSEGCVVLCTFLV
eukprot:GSMAST32.ASY1.ANO1.1070.1 assembled CDS